MREILLSLKLRSVDFAKDVDSLILMLREKPSTDLIIAQNDLPPSGCAAIAKFIRWDRWSPNPKTPIVSVGLVWTLETINSFRDLGVNEVVSVPTSLQVVQRKLQTALGKDRPFISVEDYRGPDRRIRRLAGYEGPFRRASDNIAAQLDEAKAKLARRSERIEQLSAKVTEKPLPVLAPRTTPSPQLVPVDPKARLLTQSRLNDFEGRRPPEQKLPPVAARADKTVEKEFVPVPEPLPEPLPERVSEEMSPSPEPESKPGGTPAALRPRLTPPPSFAAAAPPPPAAAAPPPAAAATPPPAAAPPPPAAATPPPAAATPPPAA
ncbi:MAG TPA: hypothetical protein HPP80_04825, partial [Rhodospirillaceae bacterium]|nr:hypothetical protein [Rhodospirillaceae bacterium]